MKIDRVLELLKIERECVTRQSPCNDKSKLCNRNCGECDIAQNDLEIIEMYDFVISMMEMKQDDIKKESEMGTIRDTNPDHYKVDDADFVEYMKDQKIAGFGDWMFANGYNTGVLTAQLDLVRCKDCKHYLASRGICEKEHAHGCAEMWFCADGERMDRI